MLDYFIGDHLDSGQKLIVLLGGLGAVAGVFAGLIGFLVFGLSGGDDHSEAAH